MTRPQQQRTYYILAGRDKHGWHFLYGDYVRRDVAYEMADYADHGFQRKDLKIITTTDLQVDIDRAMAELRGQVH